MTSCPPRDATARAIVDIGGKAPGALLIVTAAVHGNEPAGVHALTRMAPRLRALAPKMRGDVVGFIGNLGAMAAKQRFLGRDLNRAWTDDRMCALRDGPLPASDVSEDREQSELFAALTDAAARARGDAVLLDIHSTSGEGPPFLLAPATCRAFVSGIPLTTIEDLVEKLKGTMAFSVADSIPRWVVAETGQHDDPATVDRAEAVIWLSLVAAGMVTSEDIPEAALHHAALDRARGGLPRRLQAVYRHAIAPGDEFRMRPSFHHFQQIAVGAVLADDRRGEVRAPFSGYLLMPLYQGQGEDGFFLAR